MGINARLAAQMAQRRQQAQNAQHQNLVGAAAKIPALDRVGNTMEIGDMVLYHPPLDLVFQIVDIKPVLDPRARPGSLVVVLAANFPLSVQAGQPYHPFVVIGASQPQERNDAEPATEAPGPAITDDVSPEVPA